MASSQLPIITQPWQPDVNQGALNLTMNRPKDFIYIEQPWEMCRVQETLTDRMRYEHVKVEALMKYSVPYEFFPYLRFLAQPIILSCHCNHTFQSRKIERFIQINTSPLRFNFQAFRPVTNEPIDRQWTPAMDEMRGVPTYAFTAPRIVGSDTPYF